MQLVWRKRTFSPGPLLSRPDFTTHTQTHTPTLVERDTHTQMNNFLSVLKSMDREDLM